jgi:hypothetical protein
VVVIAAPEAARLRRGLITVQFNSKQVLPHVAVNNDALPNSPADAADCIKSFRLPGQTLPRQTNVSRVSLQTQYQAFVRSCGRKQRSSEKAIALNWTCVLEPFTRGGLSRFENSGLHPQCPCILLGNQRGQQPWTDVVHGT